MSQNLNEDPRLRNVQVTDSLRETIVSLLEYIPELKSVGVVLDWNIGRTEYPFGMMIGRKGMVRTADELFSLMEQTAKLCNFQAKTMAEVMVGIDLAATDLSKKSKAIIDEIKALESKKEHLLKERNSDEQK